MANNRIVIEGIEDYEILPRELAAAAEPLVAPPPSIGRPCAKRVSKVSGELRGGVIVSPWADVRSASSPITSSYSTAPYAAAL